MADARESLPAVFRHAVDQTIAAERLEGWHPTDGQIGALIELGSGRQTFGQYLAQCRARHPAAVVEVPGRWQLLRRNRPYLIPGMMLLRNNFGADSSEMLADLEFVATAGRILQWHLRLVDGGLDPNVRLIHQHVFADVYSWAGSLRTTELHRGETTFGSRASLPRGVARVDVHAAAVARNDDLDGPALAYELARIYAEYNRLHPFREGNGRTGTLLLHTVVRWHGRTLDFSGVTRQEWYGASRDAMPFRRDGQANHRPLLPLMLRALGG